VNRASSISALSLTIVQPRSNNWQSAPIYFPPSLPGSTTNTPADDTLAVDCSRLAARLGNCEAHHCMSSSEPLKRAGVPL
jgi:hypothetical protein